MKKGNWSQSKNIIPARHSGGDLQEALAAYKVSLEAGTERISPPGNTGGMQAGTAQQSIVQHGTKGCARRQLGGDGAADNGEEVGHGKTVLGEEPVGGTPILKLRAGSSEQASHGVASETK